MDEAGRPRQIWTDALGRIIEADLPWAPTGVITSGDTVACYGYNHPNELDISMGSQTRTYKYDALGRLTSESTPEVSIGSRSSVTQCATTYTYNSSGDLATRVAPKPNQNSSCSTTVTTTYAFDQLHRLTSKSYNDGATPAANFFYDQSTWAGQTLNNHLGRLTSTCAGPNVGNCTSATAETGHSYDPAGRIAKYWDCTPSKCGNGTWLTQYSYDVAGNLLTMQHPAGFTLTYSYDSANHPTGITSGQTGSTYPATLATMTYGASGQLAQLTNGCAGTGCLQAQEEYAYNSRLQPVFATLGTSASGHATDYYCWVYNYYQGVGNSNLTCPQPFPSLPVPASDYPPTASSGNNGNVAGYLYQDNQTAANSHTASYTYDYMNRLAKSVASPLQNGGASYNLTFYDMNPTSPKGYDTDGNVTCVMESGTSGPCPQLGYDTNTANNHISSAGYSYDAAGNVTNDGTHTYQWDAEGRLTSVDSGSTMNYISYDVFGHRVQAQFGTGGDELQYLVDPAGQKEANWFKVAGTWYGQYVRLNGRYISNYYNSQASFYHPNALGSITQGTTYSGSATGAALLYPWGQGWVPLNNGTIFAGFQDWDGGTDSFPAWFRMYAAGQYRWLTPDPAGLGAADFTNPQSLNRYAYATNNPATSPTRADWVQ